MQAILCKSFGPPESLSVETLPDPVAGPGEVIVDVAFTGLNFFDTLIIQNRYQIKPDLPFSPGAEFSGRVVATGPDASDFAVGQRVCGTMSYGAARSRIAVRESALTAVPDGLSDEKAAGLLVTYGTSMHALKQRADIKPGETLAVLGASGGVGIAAVEIGVAMGARVIACASSADKIAFAKSAGAFEGIDYSQAPLKDELRRLTGGKGVDVVYDPVGGDYSEQALRAIAWEGRFLVVGFAAGPIPKIPLNLVLLKGCQIVGVYWGGFVASNPAENRTNIAQLLEWARDGRISAPVHSIFAPGEIAAALGVLTRREALGKVLIRMR